jgi:hypothetical protein
VTTEKKYIYIFAYLFAFHLQQGTRVVILEENTANISILMHSVLRSRYNFVF